MAQYVIAGAQAGQAVTQTVVGMADAAAHIEDVVRQEAAKNKEAMRNEDNEFNIRKNFLDNAVNAIQQATCSQFNIVICTNQEKDDFQNLEGRILPMDLLNLEISQGKFVNFEVYVFDTGKYLRHGKYERDYWNFWGNDKPFYDPAAMHVHFTHAQKKLDAAQVKQQQDAKAASDKTADDAKKAAAATAAEASKTEASTLKTEADKKAADAAQQAQGLGNPDIGADPGITPYNGSGGAGDAPSGGMSATMGGPDASSAVGGEPQGRQAQGAVAMGPGMGGDSPLGRQDGTNAGMSKGMPFGMAGTTGAGVAGGAMPGGRGGPHPSFANHIIGVAAGPAMQMMMG